MFNVSETELREVRERDFLFHCPSCYYLICDHAESHILTLENLLHEINLRRISPDLSLKFIRNLSDAGKSKKNSSGELMIPKIVEALRDQLKYLRISEASIKPTKNNT